eukprot:TRINITY_DN18609_c0_g1_i1.p2 TRINITY_DN18609_c0_g1~~TRINITY_DN18609_c0_g1_i1.p2  ORF type:complete len:111 (+),score=21.15 TRINITY_DN18609_c0_g1_i1:180-512(+)
MSFRVWPDAMDCYMHMNNSSYHKIADYGRFHFFAVLGIIRHAPKEGWHVTNAGNFLNFRQSLQPFQSYSLETRVHSCDDRWLFLEQTHDFKIPMLLVVIVSSVFFSPQNN